MLRRTKVVHAELVEFELGNRRRASAVVRHSSQLGVSLHPSFEYIWTFRSLFLTIFSLEGRFGSFEKLP